MMIPKTELGNKAVGGTVWLKSAGALLLKRAGTVQMKAYIKNTEQDELLRAIHTMANGDAIFSPGIAQRVLGYLNTPEPDLTGQRFRRTDTPRAANSGTHRPGTKQYRDYSNIGPESENHQQQRRQRPVQSAGHRSHQADAMALQAGMGRGAC
jgi:hypothetical protein